MLVLLSRRDTKLSVKLCCGMAARLASLCCCIQQKLSWWMRCQGQVHSCHTIVCLVPCQNSSTIQVSQTAALLCAWKQLNPENQCCKRPHADRCAHRVATRPKLHALLNKRTLGQNLPRSCSSQEPSSAVDGRTKVIRSTSRAMRDDTGDFPLHRTTIST